MSLNILINSLYTSNNELDFIESSYFFGQKKAEPSQTIKIVYSKINNILGEEIFVGSWELVDQNCINGFATLTGDDQWIHTNKDRAKKESPFKTTIAHGFLTLEDDTIFQYKCDSFYNPKLEECLLWNDPSLKIDWNTKNPIISSKDLQGKLFKDIESNI